MEAVGGIVRRARRPPGWIAPGPRPSRAHDVGPRPGEDLCYLAGEWRILQRLDGHRWSLDPLSAIALYLLGLAGEVLIISSVYLVMPVGRLRFRHALIGGVVATLLWEITRHFLVWYFAHLSKIGVVYGSLATAIVVLLSLEIGATLLLLGAQVISEYERLAWPGRDREPAPMRTGE